MAKPTPAPWLRAGHTVYALTTDKRGHVVNRFTALMQSARQPHEAQDDELMANAVLAQAAPDLLAALVEIVEASQSVDADTFEVADRMQEIAVKAVAKARGS